MAACGERHCPQAKNIQFLYFSDLTQAGQPVTGQKPQQPSENPVKPPPSEALSLESTSGKANTVEPTGLEAIRLEASSLEAINLGTGSNTASGTEDSDDNNVAEVDVESLVRRVLEKEKKMHVNRRKRSMTPQRSVTQPDIYSPVKEGDVGMMFDNDVVKSTDDVVVTGEVSPVTTTSSVDFTRNLQSRRKDNVQNDGNTSQRNVGYERNQSQTKLTQNTQSEDRNVQDNSKTDNSYDAADEAPMVMPKIENTMSFANLPGASVQLGNPMETTSTEMLMAQVQMQAQLMMSQAAAMNTLGGASMLQQFSATPYMFNTPQMTQNTSSGQGGTYNYSNPSSNYTILDGRYTCKLCGKSYTKRANLSSHMLLHKGRIYTCTMCAKTFNHPNYLSQHMKYVHSARRDFRCKFCGKEFAKNQNLQVHLARHAHEQHHSSSGSGYLDSSICMDVAEGNNSSFGSEESFMNQSIKIEPTPDENIQG